MSDSQLVHPYEAPVIHERTRIEAPLTLLASGNIDGGGQ
jgi:hypothetical protein